MNKFYVGLLLLIVGAAMLVFGGISYTTQDRTIIGPVTIEHPEEHRIRISPIAGVILAVTGGVLMITGRPSSPRRP